MPEYEKYFPYLVKEIHTTIVATVDDEDSTGQRIHIFNAAEGFLQFFTFTFNI